MLLVENRDLLNRFRDGDRSALEEVYLGYAQPVVVTLRQGFSFKSGGRNCRFNGTRSQFELEDRLHDVFARAFSEKARLSYDGLKPYGSYLRSIAKNLVIDEFRRKEKSLTDYSYEILDALPANESVGAANPLCGEIQPSGRPDHDSESRELIDLVASFKTTLPAREKRVYELRFEQELQHQEISIRTGMSASKVKTSEERIRVQFFDHMKAHGYFAGYVQKRRGWLQSLRGMR